MENIEKEFRYFMEEAELPVNYYGNKIYVDKSSPVFTIDDMGNITTTENCMYRLVVNSVSTGVYAYSNDYFGIKHIFGDFYVVINSYVKKSNDIGKSELDNMNFELKFGVIKLGRSIHNNSVMACEEKIIAPIIYDRIYVYDSEYLIMEKDNCYTYFCIGEKNKNYGKQLMPLVLEGASPFNIKYDGFAECIIDGEVRFIPIDFIARDRITKEDLLTEEEVLCLLNSYSVFNKINMVTNIEVPKLVRRLQKDRV